MIDERFYATDEELQEVRRRLENWGRWAAARAGRGRAYSAEGRYRPERGDHEPRREVLPDVDPHDASRIDRCIAPVRGFPIRSSRLLLAHFVHRAFPAATCRRLQMPRDSYEAELHRAMYALHRVLTRA